MYDPNIPQAGTEIDAVQMRGQLNGLKEFIDAIISLTGATVDGVNTINFNEPATATVNLVGSVLHFSFDIPRGGVGAPGPPFAQALVDAVYTLDPGQPATVSVYFDGTYVRFTFGIPRGETGYTGPQGDQGPPGEVTNAALSNAISGTSSNTNAVSTLDTPFADPDAESMRQAYNALVLALRLSAHPHGARLRAGVDRDRRGHALCDHRRHAARRLCPRSIGRCVGREPGQSHRHDDDAAGAGRVDRDRG